MTPQIKIVILKPHMERYNTSNILTTARNGVRVGYAFSHVCLFTWVSPCDQYGSFQTCSFGDTPKLKPWPPFTHVGTPSDLFKPVHLGTPPSRPFQICLLYYSLLVYFFCSHTQQEVEYLRSNATWMASNFQVFSVWKHFWLKLEALYYQ